MTALLNTTYKKSILVTLCASIMLCTSCTDEDMVQTLNKNNQVSFGASISGNWDTKAVRATNNWGKTYDARRFENSDMWLITTTEINTDSTFRQTPTARGTVVTTGNFASIHDSFNVYAYTYTGNSWEQADDIKLYAKDKVVQNGGVSQDGKALWSYSPERYWPGASYQMKFFAYAPESMNPTANGKTLSVNHQVVKEVTEQKDLLVAIEEASGAYNQPLNLNFKHILTAVKVKVAKGVSGTINSITFKGINNAGTHTFGTTTWSGSGDEEYTLPVDITLTGNETDDTFIADGDNTFLMIPQVLDSNAELVVEFSGYPPLRANLSGEGKEWLMGHTVIYKISKTDIVMEFDVQIKNSIETNYAQETEVDHLGTEDVNLIVTSKKHTTVNGQLVTTEVPWKIVKIESSPDGTTWTEESNQKAAINAWFDLEKTFPTSDVQSKETTADVVEQWFTREYEEADESFPTITINDSKGVNPYNLANQSTGGATNENTANCYIVSAPGVYSIPLVYGNALKNGVDNPKAYTHQAQYDKNHADAVRQILPVFLNYQNVPINSYSITGAASAKLLWQDEPGLITSVELIDQNKLTFTTGNNLQQGNAVIAIMDQAETIMWSWHIWFTQSGLGSGNIANCNLGWCESPSKVVYKQRKIKITFKQEGNEQTQSIVIAQKGAIEANKQIFGNNTYYQWGRKDPFPGNTGSPSSTVNAMWDFVDGLVFLTTNKPIYNINNEMLRFWDGKIYVDNRSQEIDDKYRIVLDIFNKMPNERTIGNVIRNPDVFYSPGTYVTDESSLRPSPAGNILYGGHFSWNENVYLNLWDTHLMVQNVNGNLEVDIATTRIHTKTIYDPCPVGYKVPSYLDFEGLEGQETFVESEYNEQNFPHVVIDGISFHILGARRVSCGQVVRATHPKDARGHHWLVEPYNTKLGSVWDFEVFGSGHKDNDGKHILPEILTCAYTDALSIRPVKDN